MAQIPWVPIEQTTELSLQPCEFYKRVLRKDDVQLARRKIVLFLLLDSTFPFFLPQR